MLVAFTGKKRSGKTTARNAAVEFFRAKGRECAVISFAFPLKEVVAKVFGFEFDPEVGDEGIKSSDRPRAIDEAQIECLDSWLKFHNLLPLTPGEKALLKLAGKEGEVWRWLLQVVGTDIVRKRDEYFWIKKAEKKLSKALSSGRAVVIDDLRFPAEAEMVKRFGGVIIKLVRIDDSQGDNHESERAVDEVEPDVEIKAYSGEVELIKREVNTILSALCMAEEMLESYLNG